MDERTHIAELKRRVEAAEAAARESDERYRTLIGTMDTGYVLVEFVRDAFGKPIDFIFIEANPALKRLTGLGPEELLGLKISEVLQPDDAHRWIEAYRRVVETQMPARIEHFVESFDGWLAVNLTPVGPNRVAAVSENITERKRAEAAQRDGQERQSFLLALSDALRPLSDPTSIQNTAAVLLGKHLNVDRAFYFTVRRDADGLVHVIERDYFSEAGKPSVVGVHPQKEYGQIIFAGLVRGRPLVVTDIASELDLPQEALERYAAIQARALITVPLIKAGEYVAGLAVLQDQPRHWTASEISLVEEVAERTWDAVERARAEAGLKQNAESFTSLIQNSPFGVYVVDADFRVVLASQKAMQTFDTVPNFIGCDLGVAQRAIWPEPFASKTIGYHRRALETGEPYASDDTVEKRADHDVVEAYDWRVERIVMPDGRFGVVCYFYNQTSRQDLLEAIRKSEEKLRLVLETEAVGVLFFDPKGVVIDANEAFLSMTGYTRGDISARKLTWRRMTPPEWIEHSEQQMEVFATSGRIGPYEKEYFLADGSRRWMLFAGRDLGDGSIAEYCIDITARKRAEETQRLLMGELNHRVKNTLASVQAIAQQTLRRSKDPRAFVTSFSGRIQSLSRTHALLSANTWQGADLQQLMYDQVLQGPVDEKMVSLRGPKVTVSAQEALHLALMTHELATNSCKYGALSNGQGTVDVSWQVDGATLNLLWDERGGPRVATTGHRGFGTVLIEQSARTEGGHAKMSVGEAGVTWNISLPLKGLGSERLPLGRFAQTIAPKGCLDGQKPEKAKLFGKRVLVIEDEPLLALDIAAMLEDAGAEVAASAATCDAALEKIKSQDFDVALLDGNLGGEPVDAVAAALTRRKAPFLFVTGYGRESLPETFAQAPMLGKPFSSDQLIEAILLLVRKPQATVRLQPDSGAS